MSEHVLAIIWIGGQFAPNRADVLIEAINETHLFAHEGDHWFEPTTVPELVEATTSEGHLYLCDDSAPWGRMPSITEACTELGLSYRIWHESLADFGSLVEVWAPGMKGPLTLTGDHTDADSFLVSGLEVSRALVLLEQGKDGEAARLLESLAPAVPPLPPFEILALGAAIGVIADDTAVPG